MTNKQNKVVLLDRKPGLYLADAGHKGRGVFCIHDIGAGEILETTPSVILNEQETEDVDKTMLVNYTFVNGDLSRKMQKEHGIKNIDHTSCVVLGMLTFCNHDQNPNATVLWEERDGTLYYLLKATHDIPAHTEICTSYSEEWFDDRIEI